ncbi:MAG: BrnT family toxin [Defluviitaleaceae bacterium]|nr:BrnT family toxin [Defluviitaleaceae bacterium]
MYKGRFIWDPEKREKNLDKHGIDFTEAASVFDDENVIYFYDEPHSQDEDRFIAIGYSEYFKMLMVCHCYRNGDKLVRIISARPANSKERAMYWR